MKEIEDWEHYQWSLECLPSAHQERESSHAIQDLRETLKLEVRKVVQELIFWYVSRLHT